MVKNNSSAGYGGILRDDQEVWICGYASGMGTCNVITTETWGILSGLRLAAKRGVRKIIIESDSRKVVQSIRGIDKLGTDDQNLVEACIREINKFLMVEVVHVMREQNKAADAIAKLAKTYPPELTIFDDPPPAILCVLRDDLIGILISAKIT